MIINRMPGIGGKMGLAVFCESDRQAVQPMLCSLDNEGYELEALCLDGEGVETQLPDSCAALVIFSLSTPGCGCSEAVGQLESAARARKLPVHTVAAGFGMFEGELIVPHELKQALRLCRRPRRRPVRPGTEEGS